MSEIQQTSDILVLGATGFVGQMTAKYLIQHSQKYLFTLGLAARSVDKLKQQLLEKDLYARKLVTVEVDLKKREDVERAVRSTRVIINCVGPYWPSGTPVVACVFRFFI